MVQSLSIALFPLAARQAGCHLLQEPLVAVGVLERREREVAATLRVAPGDASVLDGSVEGKIAEVKDFAHIGAACFQLRTGRVDVIYGQDQAAHRAWLRPGHSLPEDHRRVRVWRS